MEMSPKEALRLAIAALEAGTMVQDRSAAAVLARLAPFVEAAMAFCEWKASGKWEDDVLAGQESLDGLRAAYRAIAHPVGCRCPRHSPEAWGAPAQEGK